MHARLGCGVVGLPKCALGAVDRRYIDDATPPTLHHAVTHLLRHVEGRIEVGVDDYVPVGLGHFLERHVARNAGVVDEDIHRPDLGPDPGDRLLARIEVGNIDRKRVEIIVSCLHLLHPVIGIRVTRRVRYDDSVAGVVHLRADGFA